MVRNGERKFYNLHPWIGKKSTTHGSLPWKVETVWQFSLHCLKGKMNLVLNYRCVHIGGDLICGVRHGNTNLLVVDHVVSGRGQRWSSQLVTEGQSSEHSTCARGHKDQAESR